MTRWGFHASHEQVSPRQLLADVQHAEQAGFDMAMCSDHFSPWSERQGHSGYTWAWLGAALATTSLRLGCVVVLVPIDAFEDTTTPSVSRSDGL